MDMPADGTYGRDQPLFMLAFDHRRSIRSLFGIEGEPDSAQEQRIRDAKLLIFEGLLAALPLPGGAAGLLVDEHYGTAVLDAAREQPPAAALACERSGQAELTFEYGDEFGAHLERFQPRFAKALVRFNCDGDEALNQRQLERLRELAAWLRERPMELLFELLVPATPAQLEQVGDSSSRFDAELRPELVRRAVTTIQEAGIEPSIWKIEGLERARDCELVAAACRRDGRDHVSCLVLGRGADDEKVAEWLRTAAPVEGFAGFAIGRTIWWDAVASFDAGDIGRAEAATIIARRYLGFVEIYREAAGVA